MLHRVSLLTSLLLGVTCAYWVPLQREVDPLSPRGLRSADEYETQVMPFGPLVYDDSEADLGFEEEPMNLMEIQEQLSAALDHMDDEELDIFSDWLVEEGHEKYLETFLGILESQLVKQYNQDVTEEQEIVDVLTDIESLETELRAAAEEQQYQPVVSNYEDNYYEDWESPAYWVYQQQQPAFQFVDPIAMQSIPSRAAFLAREIDPVAMKRYVLG